MTPEWRTRLLAAAERNIKRSRSQAEVGVSYFRFNRILRDLEALQGRTPEDALASDLAAVSKRYERKF